MKQEKAIGILVLAAFLLSGCKPVNATPGIPTDDPNRPDINYPDLTLASLPRVESPDPTAEMELWLTPHNRITPTVSVVLTQTPEPNPLFDIVEKMKIEYSVSLNDIPEPLRRGTPSAHPYFNAIPEIVALRNQLKMVSGAKKWSYVAQIVGLIGVQTREEIQDPFNRDDVLYKWNYFDLEGNRVLTCNTYATTLLRALGLEADISHWFSLDRVLVMD